MGTTLYLLRRHSDCISSSLFRAGDADMDIVFVEQSISSSVKGIVVAGDGMASGHSHPTMTYGDLVEKIFSSERVIVL